MPNARFSAFDADSFAILKWIAPVPNEAVFHREGGAQRVDAVVVAIGNDSAGERNGLAGLLSAEEDAVRIIDAIHFHDVGVCDQQRRCFDFRSHARASQQTVVEGDIRAKAGQHDLAGLAEIRRGGRRLRVIGDVAALKGDFGNKRANHRSRPGLSFRHGAPAARDAGVTIKGRPDLAPTILQIGIRTSDSDRGRFDAQRKDCAAH